ncbi:MAG: GNAT family N-acetyltransferase [Mucilaginibacter sp.]
MAVTIRLATFEDVPHLLKLIDISVRGLSANYYTPNQIESSLKYLFGVDSQLIIDSTYYVAEIDGVMVGCGGWSKRNTLFGGDQHKQVEDPLLDPAKDAARIRAFFVHPGYARQGIGRHIIDVCEAEALKNGFTRFELGATLSGVPLYTAMGYQPVKRVDTILPDGEVLGVLKMERRGT